MALIYAEGFEGLIGSGIGNNFGTGFWYNAAVDVPTWYRFAQITGDIKVASGRDSGYAARIGYQNTLKVGFAKQTPFWNVGETLICGGAINFSDFGTVSESDIFSAAASTSIRSRVRVDINGYVKIYDGGGTLRGTSASPLVLDTWYYIEVKYLINNSGAGSIEVKVDGTTIVSASSISTGVNFGLIFVMVSSSTAAFLLDDFYLCDGSGSYNNNFLGPCKVEFLSPNADNSVAWTPNTGSNYAAVDETPNTDEDTTYVETSSSSANDLYDFSNLTGSGDVLGVAINVRTKAASAASFRIIAQSGSTIVNGVTFSTATAYNNFSSSFDIDPDISDVWTESSLNAAQFGIQQISGTPRMTFINASVLREYGAPVNEIEQDVETELSLDSDAEPQIEAAPIEREVSTDLDLSDDAIGNIAQIHEEDASSELEMDHDLIYHGPIPVEVDSEITLTDAVSRVYPIFVSNDLELDNTCEISSTIFIRKLPDGMYDDSGNFDITRIPFYPEDVLKFIQFADQGGDKRASASSTLATLTHTLQLSRPIINQLISQLLTFTQKQGLTHSESVSSSLDLISIGERALKESSNLGLIQTVDAFQTKDGKSTLNLVQTLVRQVNNRRFVDQDLNIYQSVVYYSSRLAQKCTYSPQVGFAGSGITPPPAIMPTLTKGTLTLTYPFVSPTITLVLRNPDFGNIDRLNFLRVQSNTRGGKLFVFADPTWPKEQVLNLTIEPLTPTQKEDLVDFLNQSLGKEIGLLDHESRQWKGIITNPDSDFTQIGRNAFSFGFEFEGSVV